MRPRRRIAHSATLASTAKARYDVRSMGGRSRPAKESRSIVSASILQRVAGGDDRAVRECLDRFGGLVWSLARRFAPADAEDAAQEVFVDLWRSAARFDPSVASETTFVSMIARRRLIDRARARGRRPRMEEVSDTVGTQPPRDRLEVADEAAAAARVLRELNPEQQKVLRLSIHEGLSHEEISRSTDLPLGTVKTHIRRALIRARELLGAERGGVK